MGSILLICLLQSCNRDTSRDTTPVLEAGINSIPTQHLDAPPAERKYSYLERELEYLMVIWPGEYDNVEQLDFDKMAKKDGEENGGHLRIHTFVEKIDVSSFGAYALYVEEYKNDNPNTISRQAIYQLSPDEAANGMKLEIYHFKQPEPRLSLNSPMDFIKDLTPSDSLLERGCELLLVREGMAFRGKTIDKYCNSDEEDISVDYQIRISDQEYWFENELYNSKKQSILPDHLQPPVYQLEKARCFTCMIDFPREEGGRPVVTKHYIQIHDQGGKFEFDYDDGRHMVFGMRNTWSFGMQRETFVIFIQEGSQSGKTLIYSWGEPGADRIGFNPGWIRAQCDLDTPRNRLLQHSLRPDS